MGPLTRILMRYLAGYLVLIGVLPEDLAEMLLNDPEIAAAIGIGLTFIAEYAYRLAKKYGWDT